MTMKMRAFEKRFVNSQRHSSRVANQAEQRLRSIEPQPGERLLDVGCGNGAAAIHLARTFRLDATGIDIDADQIQAAAEAANGLTDTRFIVGDATKLPFADDEFDLVYTNKTTHHIPDWRQAISEMARVLKPCGHLLYHDFFAPFGQQFPTRAAINQLAGDLSLQAVQQQSSPFHYTIILRRDSDARSRGHAGCSDLMG